MRLTLSVLFFMMLLSGCKQDHDISPSEEWSAGCVTFAADGQNYRLSGMCCAYVIVSKIKLKGNSTFSSAAKYYTYTGAGYERSPVTLEGKLSDNRDTLQLSYTLLGKTNTFVLKAGKTTMACLCACD